MIFYVLLFSQSSISVENLDYNKWLKSEKFSNNLIQKIEQLLSTKNLSKVNKKENVKEIQNQIVSHLNIITKYQYEYIQLRSSCTNKIGDINFDYFIKIENCIKNNNLVCIDVTHGTNVLNFCLFTSKSINNLIY